MGCNWQLIHAATGDRCELQNHNENAHSLSLSLSLFLGVIYRVIVYTDLIRYVKLYTMVWRYG